MQQQEYIVATEYHLVKVIDKYLITHKNHLDQIPIVINNELQKENKKTMNYKDRNLMVIKNELIQKDHREIITNIIYQ